ncbi:NADP-dependent oxidoreductase [Acidothermaceae bacterium B102]|nr:NADP-dependent oxidoreductase [Acidothermaceae bacterium B102]
MARAVRFDRYGSTEVLYLADVDAPRPDLGEVVVAVQAAATNPGEVAIREGLLDALYPTTFPCGEGSDLAGIVSQVGTGVTTFDPGNAVLGWTDKRASHADYVVVPATQLIHKPAAMSWEVAGSLYVVGVTAYAAVRAVALQPGDTVVVSAAAGGVGSVAVQLAKLAGARVIGIASQSNHNWLRSVGVTPIAYGEGLLSRIKAAAQNGVDAFVDTHGADYVKLAVDLGVAPDRIDTIIAFEAAQEFGAKTEASADASDSRVLAELADLVATGRVVIPIAATYPLHDVKKAYLDLSQGHTHGKIVLIP